jgi:hypothetical protein
VRLDPEPRELLSRTRIGMLALKGRLPLVNPAAFHFGGDAVWMTTSRHAVKLVIAQRDPRVAFLVTPERAGGRQSRQGRQTKHGVLLQGLLETFNPRSLRSQMRAVMQGPGFALNLAAYALKNAAFVGGYLLDLTQVPGDWWPHNRVLLRLRPDRVRLVPAFRPPVAAPVRVSRVPGQVATAVSRHRDAQLCWLAGGLPVLAAAAWTLDGSDALAWLPADVPRPPRDGAPAALVIEHHHPFRATRMLGLCLRGRMSPAPEALATINRRYEEPLPEEGTPLRLEVSRVTWWRGFDVGTSRVQQTAISEAAGK